ncbi:MAG: PEPxxWA-CTERM sorting domain-containing protein [Sphingomonas sp.]|nr:PEPxxWA-CTERM sorting domain-containing protein [Sphingomonas sp.]
MFSFQTSSAPGSQLFGGPASGSGIFTTSDTSTQILGQTAFRILSITGTVNGSAIVAPTLAAGYGNYFTTGPTFLDGSGVNFRTVAQPTIAFFNQSSNGLYRINTTNPFTSSYLDATSSAVAAVPEPAAWGMMILGFAMLGGAMRYRRRTTRIAFA